jgi:acetylornithine/succinyldiaminopimelate/putrescine aminotransferase
VEPSKVVANAMDQGLLILGAGSDVVRFVPPLVVQEADMEAFEAIMDTVLEACL